MGPNPLAERNENIAVGDNGKCRGLRGLLLPVKTKCNTTVSSKVSNENLQFHPKKALILSKTTRWNVEKKRYAKLEDYEIAYALAQRGSDYTRIRGKHRQHCDTVNAIAKQLREANIRTRIVQKADYTDKNIAWADVIFSAGGDGTFLLAASRIKAATKITPPVIGINTDPDGSEGHLCLMNKLSVTHFGNALKRLLAGDFNWLYRQRIRVTITGAGKVTRFVPSTLLNDNQDNSDFINEAEIISQRKGLLSPFIKTDQSNNNQILALNEVFIGEAEAARVSYYEVKIDDLPLLKQKSSGLTVCTGTGSTSWHYNTNRVTEQSVSDLLTMFAEKLGIDEEKFPIEMRDSIVDEVSEAYNRKLIFDPSSQSMAYSIREAVFNATFPAMPQRGDAYCVQVKSRCSNANLVVDGGLAFEFNDGAMAVLEIRPEDALRTVIFR